MTDLDNLQTFYSLFSQWRFHIPDYQRGYAKFEEFFSCLERLASEVEAERSTWL